MNLLSPTNQRPVTYHCPACAGVHATNVPVMWKGVKQMWLVSSCNAAVRVAVDCSVKAAA